MRVRTKIAIIGVGLLGGSLALALKKKGNARLIGWNHRPGSRKKAAKLLPVAASFEEAVRGADVVVLCSHSRSIQTVLGTMAPLLSPNALVMDVSSVKAEVASEAGSIAGMADHFVPCHPMAGREKSGPAHADGGLYDGKTVFLTPLPKNPPRLVRRASTFWRNIGAVTTVLTPPRHDRQVALTSHLPHLLASALVDIYGKEQTKDPGVRKAVGSGFRDLTRIAAGNPAMWSDIVAMNSAPIRAVLKRYRDRLDMLDRNLKKGRTAYWNGFFERARKTREKL